MRVSLRLLAVVTLMAVTLSSASRPAWAGPVDDNGDGQFTGAHTFNDNRKSNKRRGSDHPPSTAEKERPEAARVSDPPAGPCATGSSCTINIGTHNLDRDDVERYVRQLIVQLQLPKPTPQFGPDPSVNEWKMAAVGYPIWLWTEGPTTVTSTESGFGYTFTLRAVYQSTTFDMGDGHTKRCTRTTPYRMSTKPGAASPTCGYTYLKAARNGSYTVTATTHWDVHWSVAGLSGTLPGTHSDSRDLPVGELQAIVVG